MSNGESDSGVIDQGPSPLFTPDQMRRLRLQLSRSPFYCEEDYFLRVLVQNSIVSQNLFVFGRFEALDGTRKPFNYQVLLAANRASQTFDTHLGEGLLFGVSAIAAGPAVDVGTMWVQATLEFGTAPLATIPLVTLFSGHVTSQQIISWPYAVAPPPNRPGVLRGIVGTTPGLGLFPTETCPTGAIWDLVSVKCRFTPFNDGAQRRINLFINNAGGSPLEAGHLATIPSTQNCDFIWAQSALLGQIASVPNTKSYVPIPGPTTLLGGDSFTIQTDQGPNGSDQYDHPIYLVRESLRIQ